MLAPHLRASNADARFKVQLPDGTSMRLAIQHGPHGMAVQLGFAATAPVQSLKASAHLLEQRLSARCGRPVLLYVTCVDDMDRDD